MNPERPSLAWRALLGGMRALPQGLLSRGVGALADIPLPGPLRGPVLGTFARSVGIDVGEAEHPLRDYGSVNAFFVRRLKPGARDFPEDGRTLASPVDGVVGALGTVTSGRAIQAKGLDYSVAALLGDPAAAESIEGGIFVTVYLSPRHYHRIHTPLPGSIVEARHVPGRLFPVNRPAVQGVDRLFVVNERLVVTMASAAGPVAVVAVGAYNVGRISAAFDPSWGGRDGASITNRGTPPPPYRRYDPPVAVERGAEIMAFHLGSTIVLLAGPGAALVDGIETGAEVLAGQPLARG
ncbi:MAG: phosphatidylserine decarboxylase [Gemmatimonadetes bacterium]|nr:phosphatidylserine decarboxylase [Gemmatimonadota bacterium]